MSNAIRQNEWREFLKAFWRDHKNSIATLEVREFLADGGTVSTRRRLAGIDVERCGDDIVLEITVGDSKEVQQIRTIRNPVSIRYIPKPASACEAMRIECSDGTDTILTVENRSESPQELSRSGSAEDTMSRHTRFSAALPRSSL
jgi:hypothetical protein